MSEMLFRDLECSEDIVGEIVPTCQIDEPGIAHHLLNVGSHGGENDGRSAGVRFLYKVLEDVDPARIDV